jgi:hypothetical protein
MAKFRDDWLDEVPTRIHSGGLGQGGTPEWSPDFARWLGVDYYGPKSDERWANNSEPRVRTKRAFRKLRKKAIREFEVCYRIVVLGEPIAGTCQWLNERAIHNAIPLTDGHTVHYTMHDTTLLLVSGITKAASWW